jgi:hypothetical protein
MFTKYKIKMDEDGLTIMQWVSLGAGRAAPALSGDNSLQATFHASKQAAAARLARSSSGTTAGGASIEPPGVGGASIEPPGVGGASIEPPGAGQFPGAGAGAPITIIGPNIFLGSSCQHIEKKKES